MGIKLESANSQCIWCKRHLRGSSFVADCQEGFGPRPRSDEHIIPRSAFGRVITTDLCKCCNERFGGDLDHAFVRDARIVNAARLAGIPLPQLWTRFEGVQHTPDGKGYRTFVKDGVFQPRSNLRSLEALTIASTDGKLPNADLPKLRARLIQKTKRKALLLNESQIVAEVDSLIRQLTEAPEAECFNPVIGEGFRPSPLDRNVHVSWATQPWMTEWCLAKAVFELAETVLRADFRQYFAEAIAEVRRFIEERACSDDGKEGVGIFTFVELPASEVRRSHVIEARMTKSAFDWSLTFFGTAKWSYSRGVEPIRAPSTEQTIRIINPIEGPDATLAVS